MEQSYKYIKRAAAFCGLMLNVMALSAQTFNLQSIQPVTVPSGATLEWHNALPLSAGNLVASPTNVGPGVYYATFHYSTCYSDPSSFKLVKIDCPYTTTNLKAAIDSTDKPSNSVITYHSGYPVTTANKLTLNASAAPVGMYFVAYYDAVKDCYTNGSPIKVITDNQCGSHADINATLVNDTATGNVTTNDNLPANAIYNTPTPNPSNPAIAQLTLNTDGTYTFVSSTPGIYRYTYPICFPDVSLPCRSELLTITVTDPTTNTNPPSVNTDNAIVDSGSFVDINVAANDQPGNPTGSLGTPTVTTNPVNGTAAVNPDGTIKYTPNPGFVGVDSFVYYSCDTTLVVDLCDTATVYVTVQPTTANSILANDDYKKVPNNTPATGNTVVNDMDPDGNPITVTTQNLTIPDVGTFALSGTGDYTFTPDSSFVGFTNFPYQICDNAGNCSMATLYIVVGPPTAPLGLNFKDIKAVWNNNDAQVKWTVSAENNNDYFAVERSFDAKQFIEVAQVKSKGNHHSDIVYNYSDLNIKPQTKDKVYYRIRQVDFDRKSTVSTVVSLAVNGSQTMAYLFPNPASNAKVSFVYQNFDIVEDVMEIQVLDIHGRMILTDKMHIGKGVNQKTCNLSALTQGVYYLRYNSKLNNVQGSLKFVKQ